MNLKKLSDEATNGLWQQGDIVEGQTVGQWQEVHLGEEGAMLLCFRCVDANFIVALVNAYRSGRLIDVSITSAALSPSYPDLGKSGP